MLSYALENKEQDRSFLSGVEVLCRAVFRVHEGDSLKKGDYLIVMLSTGKKYKGLVIDYPSVRIEDIIVGELIIRRA
jgi:hypothetical protein